MSLTAGGHKYYLNIYQEYIVLIDQENTKKRCKFDKKKYFYLPLVKLVEEFNNSMLYLEGELKNV